MKTTGHQIIVFLKTKRTIMHVFNIFTSMTTILNVNRSVILYFYAEMGKCFSSQHAIAVTAFQKGTLRFRTLLLWVYIWFSLIFSTPIL